MPPQQERYSGDIARFIALNIVSVGGGKIDMDSLPSLHGGWDLQFVNPGGIKMQVYQVSFDQTESILTQILGVPFFTGGSDQERKTSSYASSNFDCEIKLSEHEDHLQILIH